MRLIVGISGASGVIMGYELLKALKQYPDCETHLVITESAARNFQYETTLPLAAVEELAAVVHDNKNIAASIASGSYRTDGMVIIPASMKTVAGLASGYAENLLLRAADVCLKENRRLVVVPREMPLSRLHLRNLAVLADLGGTIIPPMLTFYNQADTVEKQIKNIIGKILMQFGLDYADFTAWEGKSD